jgi:hypothetical protein
VRKSEQWAGDAGESAREATLHDEAGLRLVDVEDRHARDGVLGLAGHGVHDVVGADDDGDIALREGRADAP